ncbi:hypothetical protein LG275_09440 [Chryseomicrobium palamuruense]
MWFLFGIIAIFMTGINFFLYAVGKDYKLAMALALSFTALSLCAHYSYIDNWVQSEDWSALADVVPIMAKALWVLTIASILLNIAPIILERVYIRT